MSKPRIVALAAESDPFVERCYVMCRLAGIVVGMGFLAIGCGPSGPARYDVSGTVTFDGQPVPIGTITFVPAGGNSGPGGSAGIEAGRFDTATTGRGPTGGPHVAIITGFDGKMVGGIEQVQEGSPLFIDYREDVDLPKEATVRDFNVPGSARLKPTAPPPPGRKA